jgi:hypothetical protein
MRRLQPPISHQEFVAEMCAVMLQDCAHRAEYAAQFREVAVRTRRRIDSTKHSLEHVDRLLGSEKAQLVR